MQTGISIFTSFMLGGFSWSSDGCLFNYIALIAVAMCVFYKVKGNDQKSRQLLTLAFILGVWGAFYALTIVAAAISSNPIPQDMRFPLLLSGFAALLQTLFIAVIGWFVTAVIALWKPSVQKLDFTRTVA